jgi:hypothetical protein
MVSNNGHTETINLIMECGKLDINVIDNVSYIIFLCVFPNIFLSLSVLGHIVL